MKIIPVVGHSKSGKTTFLEKLIPELKELGFRVAVIKHAHHGFDLDHEGKDSHRLKQTGAEAISISGPDKVALIKDTKEELSLDYLANEFFPDYDVVLSEGFKNFPVPKIEILRSEISSKPLCKDGELILLATDKKINFKTKQFSLDDAKKIAAYLKENYLQKPGKKIRARLTVNNKKVPMKSFVQDLIGKTVAGLASSLKEVESPKKIFIEVNLEKEKKKK